MKRLAGNVVALGIAVFGVAACQSGGPVYYQAGPRPITPMEVQGRILAQGAAQSTYRSPIQCQSHVLSNGNVMTTCQ